ncbi:WYL domain-containing protein [Pseudomonas sp. LS1212]|uniref:helix-turn-helix transcriptional regulator n=1 Tax=Pseudomonas sp. LS1212 TaxID=2972478 RepID=UPI00215C8902|nr:WYL domain-containing protein [Pseudomonas sp. LS1212]UVJ43903.1 WYL domain-containing protein [Pseudomonas sp. LS1212]
MDQRTTGPDGKRGQAAITRDRRNRLHAKIAAAGKTGITTAELEFFLQEEGFKEDIRTVQRDVKHLRDDHEIVMVEGDPAPRWSLAKTSRLNLTETLAKPPTVDPKLLKSARVALSIVTLYEQASHLLHQAALDDLEEQYQSSKQLLEKHLRHEGRWLGKVVMGTQQLQLRQAQINERWLHEVQLALLGAYQLEALYYSQNSAQEKRKVINPLGLSYQDSSIYVICTFAGEELVRTLPLQRFREIKPMSAREAVVPAGFNLKAHTQRLVEPGAITLKLRINEKMRRRLDPSETPLAEHQCFTRLDEKWWLLECETTYSQGLVWWVLSHGESLEVLEPARLRQKVGQCVTTTASYYANNPDFG